MRMKGVLVRMLITLARITRCWMTVARMRWVNRSVVCLIRIIRWRTMKWNLLNEEEGLEWDWWDDRYHELHSWINCALEGLGLLMTASLWSWGRPATTPMVATMSATSSLTLGCIELENGRLLIRILILYLQWLYHWISVLFPPGLNFKGKLFRHSVREYPPVLSNTIRVSV